ncbi:MAG: VOC family protein [Hyphomicrobiaceae bacterium]|nr:VOC family protein [Hyphomicrobiaceae bacterium]
MSRIYGEVRQLGYVVRDIEAAMKHWVEVLGVGPWFYVDRLPVRHFAYRGRPSDPHVSIALANSGRVQIELIQQRNDAPSMYLDFLASGPEGLQHVSTWPVDYEATLARGLAA